MCLIIASPTGKRISNKILEEAANTNSNGAGIAWSDKGQIFFKKGLDVKDVQEILDKEIGTKPWVAHFRIATIGGPIPELTHPFTIDEAASIAFEGQADSVLFQNGTFSQWKEHLLQACASRGCKVPESPWSDTRAIAFLCNIYGKHILSLLDNSSRFLVFDAKDTTDRRIMLWGEWHDFEEFKFSNRGTSAFSNNFSSRHPAYDQRNRGGGQSASNFQAAAQVEETESAAESTEINNPDSATETTVAGGISSSNSKSNSGSALSRRSLTSRESRRFTPKANYDVWRHLDASGAYIKADNEPDPTA